MSFSIDEKYNFAIEARKNSYSPYSSFAVGAVLLFKNGDVVKGCNIENASFGLTNCAERTAIFSAISLGYNLKDVEEVVIIADSPRPVSPCGACRQVFFEFLDVKTKVTLFNLKKERKETTVEELLPYSFVEEDMK